MTDDTSNPALVWRCPNGDGDSRSRICWLCKAECDIVVDAR